MNRILTSLLLALPLMLAAQAPNRFSYQSIIRDGSGVVQPNSAFTLGLEIHQTTAAGPTVYEESHAVTTNSFGLANVSVGGGLPNLAPAAGGTGNLADLSPKAGGDMGDLANLAPQAGGSVTPLIQCNEVTPCDINQ